MRVHVPLALAAALLVLPASAIEMIAEGKPAPSLTGSVWIGSPVSMDAVKGNAVVLAFWNADAPC